MALRAVTDLRFVAGCATFSALEGGRERLCRLAGLDAAAHREIRTRSRAARSGDPGGHPASGRVEGARRAGDGEAQGRRGTCQTGSRACRTGSGACAAGSRGTLGRAGSRRGVGGRSSACSSALLSLGRMTAMCGCVRGRRWSCSSGWRTSTSQLSGTPSTATTKSSSTLPSRNAIAS